MAVEAPPKPITPVAVPPPEPVPPPPPAPGEPNPFAEIDAVIDKVDPGAFPKAPETPQPKPPEPKPHTPPAQPKQADNKNVPKQLREDHERLKTELEAKNKSHADLEAKIKDYESKGKDVTLLEQKLVGMEKEMNDLRAKNRVLKFETSDTYKGEEAKFSTLSDEAEEVINQIEFDTTNPETQEVTHHKPGFAEFVRIYGFRTKSGRPDRFIAANEAERVFGPKGALIVMDYFNRLHGIDSGMRDMKAKEFAEWKSNSDKEQADAIVKRDATNIARQNVRKDLVERNELYRDKPEDKESTDLRNKAYAIFDAEPASEAHRIVKEESIRHIVASHGPMKLKIARLEAELAKLKEKENGKNEVPGKTKRGGGEAPTESGESWEEAARKAMAE